MELVQRQAETYELEDQFILRLPSAEAGKVRDILKNKPEKISKYLKIDLNAEKRLGTVYTGKKYHNAILKKLPTITESYKTNICNNKSTLIKTADISQLLQCTNGDISKEKFEASHGLTPPLKNIKKNRFRKTLHNSEKAIEVESVVKELYYLLRTDYEAVSTRYQLYYEDNGTSNTNKELVLFGHLSTDSEHSESEKERNSENNS